MSEPMSNEKLQFIETIFQEAGRPGTLIGNAYGAVELLLTEIHRLRAREKELHKMVRKLAIDLDETRVWARCNVCLTDWPRKETELHAPGCLAAPMEKP